MQPSSVDDNPDKVNPYLPTHETSAGSEDSRESLANVIVSSLRRGAVMGFLIGAGTVAAGRIAIAMFLEQGVVDDFREVISVAIFMGIVVAIGMAVIRVCISLVLWLLGIYPRPKSNPTVSQTIDSP